MVQGRTYTRRGGGRDTQFSENLYIYVTAGMDIRARSVSPWPKSHRGNGSRADIVWTGRGRTSQGEGGGRRQAGLKEGEEKRGYLYLLEPMAQTFGPKSKYVRISITNIFFSVL